MHRQARGFTLIELLVVMAIVAGLLAGGTFVVLQAQKKRMQSETSQRLTEVGAWLEQLNQPDNLGRYPPTDTSALLGPGTRGAKIGAKVGKPNDTNVGIETVFLTYFLNGLQGTAPGSEWLENLDDDEANELIGSMKVRDLFEIVDAYGNPLCYIHSRDYKNPKKYSQYVLPGPDGGRMVKALPKTNDKTGQFVRLNSYQLFSFGPDGEPNTEDDIHFGTE